MSSILETALRTICARYAENKIFDFGQFHAWILNEFVEFCRPRSVLKHVGFRLIRRSNAVCGSDANS